MSEQAGILVIRPSGIPPSAYMARLGLKRVIIGGQSYTADELDAIAGKTVRPLNAQTIVTPLPDSSNQIHD